MYEIGKERALFIANKIFEELIYEISLSEDNKMTFLETASTLSGTVPKGVRSKDVILVENLKKGLDFVLSKASINDLYLDKQTITMLNRMVSSNDNFDNLGGFRLNGIRIGGAKHKGVNPSLLDFEFSKLVNWYYSNNKKDKYIDLFLNLSKIQLFGDGNKRTAQLMMCGLLIQDGYCPFTINLKDVIYAKPLVEFYDNENLRFKIKELMFEKQNEILVDFLNDKEIEDIKYKKDNKIR